MGKFTTTTMLFAATILVIAAAAMAASAEDTPPPPLKAIHVSGSSGYEIGKKTGEIVKEDLERLLEVDTSLEDYLIPWMEANPSDYAEFLRVNNATFPEQFEELQGFCDATGMNFTSLFLLMLRPEIQGLLTKQRGGGGVRFEAENCFDVIANPASGRLIVGHNEDWATQYGPFGYLIYVGQTHTQQAAREIATYSYPASSLGFTFGWNSDGLVVSCNGITPSEPRAGGYGRYFINRYVLEARSLDDALGRLRLLSAAAAYGFGVTLAMAHSTRAVHVEIGPGRFSAVYVNEGSSFVHTNMFSHADMADIPQAVGPSTAARYARAQELMPVLTEDNVRSLLGDTKNASYPIYRTGKAPDTGATLVTAVFDLAARTVALYNSNPKTTDPLMIIPIYDDPHWSPKQPSKVYARAFWPVLAVAIIAIILAVVGFVLYFRKAKDSEKSFRDPLLS